MFDGKEVTSNTAFELQYAACLEALVCTKVREVGRGSSVQIEKTMLGRNMFRVFRRGWPVHGSLPD